MIKHIMSALPADFLPLPFVSHERGHKFAKVTAVTFFCVFDLGIYAMTASMNDRDRATILGDLVHRTLIRHVDLYAAELQPGGRIEKICERVGYDWPIHVELANPELTEVHLAITEEERHEAIDMAQEMLFEKYADLEDFGDLVMKCTSQNIRYQQDYSGKARLQKANANGANGKVVHKTAQPKSERKDDRVVRLERENQELRQANETLNRKLDAVLERLGINV